MHFQVLLERLVAHVRERVRSGEVTERSLARLTGMSQPHIHNVLKGIRLLSTSAADQILRSLHLTVLDLCTPAELESFESRRAYRADSCFPVPVLRGLLGPDHPLPITLAPAETYPVPLFLLAGLEDPVMARLGEDAALLGQFRWHDVILLDRSEARRSSPEPGAYYVVNRNGRGMLRRAWRQGGQLLFITGAGPCQSRDNIYVSLAGENILSIVKARVVWMGRHMEFPLLAPRPTEEAG